MGPSENIKYLKEHNLHVTIDNMVHVLVEKQDDDFRSVILGFLRKLAKKEKPQGAAGLLKVGETPSKKGFKRERSVTMLKSQQVGGGVVRPSQSVHLGDGIPLAMEGRSASRSRRGSSLGVVDRELPSSHTAKTEPKKPPPAVQPFSDIAGTIVPDTDDFGCHCTPAELMENIPKKVLQPDPTTIDFKKLFYKCQECNRRPAQMLSLTDLHTALCRPHAGQFYNTHLDHKLWVNYDISIYEKVFWCFKCGMFTSDATDPLDDLLMALCDTKTTFLDDPVRDIMVEVLEDDLAVTGSVQGWRSTQEDAHYAAKVHGVYVFAVFDGHGGTLAAEWAGCSVEKYLGSIFKKGEGIPDEDLKAVFVKMDEDLNAIYSEQCSSVGSTCCLVLVTPDEVICANLGDSRAVLYSATQGVLPLSNDHTLDDSEEAKRVVEAGYSIKSNRIEGLLSVPRAFGDFDFKQCGGKTPFEQAVSVEPTIIRHVRTADDTFIINACDGVWDGYNNEDACSHILKTQKSAAAKPPTEGEEEETVLTKAVTTLLAENICPTIDDDAIGTDNQTCIIVDLKKIPLGPKREAVTMDRLNACIVIQCFARRVAAKVRVERLKKERDDAYAEVVRKEAARVVETWWWGRKGEDLRNAAVKVQAVWKGYVATRMVRDMKEEREREAQREYEERAAIAIQRAVKDRRARRVFNAVMLLQRVVRQQKALREFQSLSKTRSEHDLQQQEDEEFAAEVIQRHYRERLKTKHAVKIQMWSRTVLDVLRRREMIAVKGRRKMPRFEEGRRMVKGVRLLQRVGLGMLARRRLAATKRIVERIMNPMLKTEPRFFSRCSNGPSPPRRPSNPPSRRMLPRYTTTATEVMHLVNSWRALETRHHHRTRLRLPSLNPFPAMSPYMSQTSQRSAGRYTNTPRFRRKIAPPKPLSAFLPPLGKAVVSPVERRKIY